MMAVSHKDRNKASRIRLKIKAGVSNAEHRDWLDDYETRINPRSKTETPAAPELDRSGQAGAGPGQADPSNQRVSSAADSRAKVQAGHVALDFGKEAEKPTPEEVAKQGIGQSPQAAICKIPDCPKCKSIVGSQECAVTGERVWPPMSIQSARGMAAMLLWAIGMGIKVFRKDKHFVDPTKEEKENLALALQMAQHRRASWIGAIDDIILLVGAIGSYTARATTEKPPKKTPDLKLVKNAEDDEEKPDE